MNTLIFATLLVAQQWIANFEQRYHPEIPKSPEWHYAVPQQVVATYTDSLTKVNHVNPIQTTTDDISKPYVVQIIDGALPYMTASETELINELPNEAFIVKE